MTFRCAICRRKLGRLVGGTVWLNSAGRHIAVCAACARSVRVRSPGISGTDSRHDDDTYDPPPEGERREVA